MVDTDISQAIRIIDAKISSLQEARNRLASAFGIGDNPLLPANGSKSGPLPVSPKTPSGNRFAPAAQSPRDGSRKAQLAKFLLAKGPMSRVAIVEQAGLPEGTISYCLNDKRFFEQTESGDWRAKLGVVISEG
jgi:hypothetical protein